MQQLLICLCVSMYKSHQISPNELAAWIKSFCFGKQETGREKRIDVFASSRFDTSTNDYFYDKLANKRTACHISNKFVVSLL